MNPTPEQNAITLAAKSSSDNLLISALAGAAKTSTLVLIANALKSTPILCLSFNRRIATEMQERLPGNCESMTLNSLGHRVWGQALGKRLIVNTAKSYNILKGLVDALPKREKEEAYKSFADTLKMVETGRTYGYVPDSHYPNAARLLSDADFFASLDEEPSELQERLIRQATLASLKQSFEGLIDFSDQILMPALFPCSFPSYPLVMVDEAQDLSELNHAILKKLVRKRLIAVGDECQSIYAFRGAHSESMKVLEQTFNMRKLILSMSFRCPVSVVEAARWRAPHMQYPEWAKPGAVASPEQWSIEDLPNTATILCRNNAPLFSMAIALLKAGRYPELVGNDIGKGLIKILKSLGEPSLLREPLLGSIDLWKQDKLKKTRRRGFVEDQAACLTVFANQGATLGEAIAYAEHILSAKGPITLMSIHKAKGLEWNDVFLLDRDLIRLDYVQEQNLLYVGITRAKETLTFVTTEGFRHGTV